MTSAAQAWVDAAVELGLARAAAVAGAEDLAARYAEPHRHYHLTAHVDAVVAHCRSLADGIEAKDLQLLILAACAHDVVYDAKPGDDERASAAWAREHLAGLAEPEIARVEELVLMTLSHEAAGGDLAGAVLLDADLSILGAAPDIYDAYTAAVRREFAWVPDDLWVTGRAAVLADLNKRSPLFLTEPARQRWEAAAHANLERELATLTPR